MQKIFILCLFILMQVTAFTQNRYTLSSGWLCRKAADVPETGTSLSNPDLTLTGWISATVPGTILTTLLDNKKIPDPFYGMNNEKIKDIYYTGAGEYTYWFVKDFKEPFPIGSSMVLLQLRGVNYRCNIFLNGHALNTVIHAGMYLRQEYNITPYISRNGSNRLAVIVYPPDPVGNPNGGQGGDGEIARSITQQYVAGWDWIQPIRDRNTGIWDEVTIEKTNTINLKNIHVVTRVGGVRFSGGAQAPCTISVSAELDNPSGQLVTGILEYELDDEWIKKPVSLSPHRITEVILPDHLLQHPKLWWPNGYGAQYLYALHVKFLSNSGQVYDEDTLRVGVREIQTHWNEKTRSMQVMVNGQKIFIKGGNWIVSDEMLRFSPARYDAELRFHRDMNLNLIRVWGGGITERPAFYDACDRYGLLVFQDFWNSGDCNGRWQDPMKKEDQWVRRQYPDDHALFLESAADQVKMIRNHPSLALWCGGNEITPTDDILVPLRDSIIAALDGTRYFFDFSNADSMSFNSLGGNGDGPYGIQDIKTFWQQKTFPFNSEVGSVGIGDSVSLARFLPEKNLDVFPTDDREDSVWHYHKYIGYGNYINAYGKPQTTRDFSNKAQLLNYDQYRALAEGFTAHMWEWYTGFIIWKTQNPWTALRGQMYDYYLDPNACLYGLKQGSEPLHVMFNPADSMVMIANNTFTTQRNLMLTVNLYDMHGHDQLITQVFNEIGASSVKNYIPLGDILSKYGKKEGVFLSLRLLNLKKEIVSDNLYWLADSSGNYSGLQRMAPASLTVIAKKTGTGRVAVSLTNPAGGPIAFFNRLSVVDANTGQRLLPVFYSDNYISVLPGETKQIEIVYSNLNAESHLLISLDGWNVAAQTARIE